MAEFATLRQGIMKSSWRKTMNFKKVNWSTKCPKPAMTRYLHIYMRNHPREALRKFTIDLVRWKDWNTQSFREKKKKGPAVWVKYTKISKKNSARIIVLKLFLFSEKCFVFGGLEGRGARSTGCWDCVYRELKYAMFRVWREHNGD